MKCFPLISGGAVNLDFEHATLAAEPDDGAGLVCGLSGRCRACILNTLCFAPTISTHTFDQSSYTSDSIKIGSCMRSLEPFCRFSESQRGLAERILA